MLVERKAWAAEALVWAKGSLPASPYDADCISFGRALVLCSVEPLWVPNTGDITCVLLRSRT